MCVYCYSDVLFNLLHLVNNLVS